MSIVSLAYESAVWYIVPTWFQTPGMSIDYARMSLDELTKQDQKNCQNVCAQTDINDDWILVEKEVNVL